MRTAKLTIKEKRQIRIMRNAKKSYTEIAKSLHIAPATAYYHGQKYKPEKIGLTALIKKYSNQLRKPRKGNTHSQDEKILINYYQLKSQKTFDIFTIPAGMNINNYRKGVNSLRLFFFLILLSMKDTDDNVYLNRQEFAAELGLNAEALDEWLRCLKRVHWIHYVRNDRLEQLKRIKILFGTENFNYLIYQRWGGQQKKSTL